MDSEHIFASESPFFLDGNQAVTACRGIIGSSTSPVNFCMGNDALLDAYVILENVSVEQLCEPVL